MKDHGVEAYLHGETRRRQERLRRALARLSERYGIAPDDPDLKAVEEACGEVPRLPLSLRPE